MDTIVWSMKVIATAKIIAASTRFLGLLAAVPGRVMAGSSCALCGKLRQRHVRDGSPNIKPLGTVCHLLSAVASAPAAEAVRYGGGTCP